MRILVDPVVDQNRAVHEFADARAFSDDAIQAREAGEYVNVVQ